MSTMRYHKLTIQCESLTMQDPYKTFTSTAVQTEDIWPI